MDRLSFPVRVVAAALLLVCFGTTGSAVRRAQPSRGGLSEAAIAIGHGQRSEAEQTARARGATDPDGAVILARLAADRGQYKEAQALLEPIVSRDPTGDAALELAFLYETVGRTGDAKPIFQAIYRDGATSSGAPALFRAARAAQALNQPRDAKAYYLGAERAGGDPVAIETAFGGLFLEKGNPQEALKSFQTVLTADPQWAPAHAGMARVFEDDDPPKAAAAAERAIAIDPQLADPHLLLASLRLDDDRDGEARAEIDKVLAVNPNSAEAHAMLAAMAYVKDDRTTFDKEVATALQINPTYSEVYRLAGQLAAGITGSRKRPSSHRRP